MFGGQQFRTFAIEELGEHVREFSTATLRRLLEEKAKREKWSSNRFDYPMYGRTRTLPGKEVVPKG